MKDFLSAIQQRRSFYSIGKDSPIPDSRIVELVQQAVKYTPSSFHMQSARAVLLFGAQHDRLWQIVQETMQKIVPPERFAATEKKLQSFAAGHGTVLFYEDDAVVESFANQFQLYQENFSIWAQQANGMAQFAVWTLLEQEGLGASLQHYNPLIDEAVQSCWKLPKHWRLVAQMPFGAPTAQPGEKKFMDLAERVKVFPENER